MARACPAPPLVRGERVDHPGDHAREIVQLQVRLDVADRPADVRRDQVERLLGQRGEAADAQVAADHDDRDADAGEQVHQVVVDCASSALRCRSSSLTVASSSLADCALSLAVCNSSLVLCSSSLADRISSLALFSSSLVLSCSSMTDWRYSRRAPISCWSWTTFWSVGARQAFGAADGSRCRRRLPGTGRGRSARRTGRP